MAGSAFGLIVAGGVALVGLRYPRHVRDPG